MVEIYWESKKKKKIFLPIALRDFIFRYHKILLASFMLASFYITSLHTVQLYRTYESSFLNAGNETQVTTSIFHCEGENGECKYFYPHLFFSKKSDDVASKRRFYLNKQQHNNYKGLGSKFVALYEEMQKLRSSKQLWIQGPPIMLLALDVRDKSIPNKNLIPPNATDRMKVTFIHVHKAGGTTIHFQSRRLPVKPELYLIYSWRKNELGIPKFAPMPERFSKQMKRGMPVRYNHESALNLLTKASKFRFSSIERKIDDHLLFAFVRDPLNRFISIIGQVMGAKGSTKTEVSRIMKQNCINKTQYTLQNSRNVIDCVISFVERKGFLTDVHFTPQATELAFASQMLPVPIAVFRYEDSYSNVLKELGMDSEKNLRDGKEKGYRIFPVLTNMTSADLTENHKRRLCKLYEEDIIMLRALDYESSSCDGFL